MSNCPFYPLFFQCSSSIFISLLPYYYSSISTSSYCFFFYFRADSLRPTINYNCHLLLVGIYRLRYTGIMSLKARSVCIFVNVIVALQLLQRVFLGFQRCFSGQFPGSIFSSITEYTIVFKISYPPFP